MTAVQVTWEGDDGRGVVRVPVADAALDEETMAAVLEARETLVRVTGML